MSSFVGLAFRLCKHIKLSFWRFNHEALAFLLKQEQTTPRAAMDERFSVFANEQRAKVSYFKAKQHRIAFGNKTRLTPDEEVKVD